MTTSYRRCFTLFFCVIHAGSIGSSQSRPQGAAQPAVRNPLLDDWGQLARYRAANLQLSSPGTFENRVVFFGDSITERWGREGGFFPGKPYINRGIKGQTTPQMLVRFRADVIALQPKVVVILAGTNDIAENTGPTTLEAIEDNLMSMVDLARVHGIRVVLGAVLPAIDFPWKRGLDPAGKIVTLNLWIRDYCSKQELFFLDYYSALADEKGGLRTEFTFDGVHPNEAGYQVMTPLAEKAIGQAIARH